MNKLFPHDIYAEYEKDLALKVKFKINENANVNRDFYHGRQWGNLDVVGVDKAVFNVIKPSVNYYISMIASDNIAVSVDVIQKREDTKIYSDVIESEIDKVFESNQIAKKTRKLVKNAVLDADGCLYVWFDTTKNKIIIDEIYNSDIVFGDALSNKVQEQPFITLSSIKTVQSVVEEARINGVSIDENMLQIEIEDYNDTNVKYVRLFTKFYKEKGTIYVIKTTKEQVIKKPIDLELKLYPFVWFSWEEQKEFYHGVSPITSIIPNQVMYNKFYYMFMEYHKKNVYPKQLYNSKVIKGWSNDPNIAIGVDGDPRESIFAMQSPNDLSNQAISLVENIQTKTKDSMGVFDAALGNAKPDNTSAIIAVQKASAQPLEMQKLDYYQCIEDLVRITIDFMRVFYSIRIVSIVNENDSFGIEFDFSQLDDNALSLNVDIGAGSYFNEILQIQTLDNLLRANILDQELYIEMLPSGYIKNKEKVLKKIRDEKLMQQQILQQQMKSQQTGQAGSTTQVNNNPPTL